MKAKEKQEIKGYAINAARDAAGQQRGKHESKYVHIKKTSVTNTLLLILILVGIVATFTGAYKITEAKTQIDMIKCGGEERTIKNPLNTTETETTEMVCDIKERVEIPIETEVSMAFTFMVLILGGITLAIVLISGAWIKEE